MQDEHMTEQCLRQTLADAGCDAQTMETILALGQQGRTAEQLRELSRFRTELVERMHTAQKSLDCLDYLIYKLKGPAVCTCCRQKARKSKDKE